MQAVRIGGGHRSDVTRPDVDRTADDTGGHRAPVRHRNQFDVDAGFGKEAAVGRIDPLCEGLAGRRIADPQLRHILSPREVRKQRRRADDADGSRTFHTIRY